MDMNNLVVPQSENDVPGLANAGTLYIGCAGIGRLSIASPSSSSYKQIAGDRAARRLRRQGSLTTPVRYHCTCSTR
jgi:hypothetical protein